MWIGKWVQTNLLLETGGSPVSTDRTQRSARSAGAVSGKRVELPWTPVCVSILAKGEQHELGEVRSAARWRTLSLLLPSLQFAALVLAEVVPRFFFAGNGRWIDSLSVTSLRFAKLAVKRLEHGSRDRRPRAV